MPKQTVIFVSRIMKGHEVRDMLGKVQVLLSEGREIEANILMLRNANKKYFTRNEVLLCQPLRKLS